MEIVNRGEFIRDRREFLKLTQDELARRLGFERSTISRWENGNIMKIKKSVLISLSQALDLKPHELAGVTIEELGLMPRPALREIPVIDTIKEDILEEASEANEYVAIEGSKADYAIRMLDNSLSGFRINVGDLLYVEQNSSLHNGDIVVTASENGEPFVYKYFRFGNTVVLLNNSQGIEKKSNEVKIFGRITQVRFDL